MLTIEGSQNGYGYKCSVDRYIEDFVKFCKVNVKTFIVVYLYRKEKVKYLFVRYVHDSVFKSNMSIFSDSEYCTLRIKDLKQCFKYMFDVSVYKANHK